MIGVPRQWQYQSKTHLHSYRQLRDTHFERMPFLGHGPTWFSKNSTFQEFWPLTARWKQKIPNFYHYEQQAIAIAARRLLHAV